MKRIGMICILVLCLSGSYQDLSAQLKYLTGYYPTWYYAILRPGVKWNGDNTGLTGAAEVSMLNYSKLTHIVMFTGVGTDTAYPYCTYVTGGKWTGFGHPDSAELEFGVSTGAPAPYLRTLIDSAHARGTKVVISMGGIYGTGAQQMSAIAADPVKTQAFVAAALGYAKRKNADGIEINWEFPYQADQTGFCRLIRTVRQGLDQWTPKGIFIATVYARTDERIVGGNLVDGTFFGYVRDSLLASIDQINLETYTMWQGNDQDYRTGFNTPVDLPTQFPNYNGYSLNNMSPGDGMGSIGTWLNAGYPASRLGMSLSPNTSVFTGATTMGQKYTNYSFGSYANVPTNNRYWDSLAQSPWYSNGVDTVITYEDTVSIRLKFEWAKSKGFGGAMLYELGSMFLPSAPAGLKDQLLRAAWSAAGVSRSSKLSLAWTRIAFSPTTLGKSKDTAVSVFNAGTDTLRITSIVSTNASFSASPSMMTILPGTTKNDTIRFMPDSIGTKTGLILFTSNDPSGPDTLTLSGDGVNSSSSPKVSLSWTSIAFSPTTLGNSKDTAVSVLNVGTDTLRITSIVSTNASFSASPSVMTILPGATKNDTIRFMPDSIGTKTGLILFASNDPAGPDTITVSGDGVNTGVQQSGSNIPNSYALYQNYPNPFNPSTTVRFDLPTRSHVRLLVFNILGQQVSELINDDMNGGSFVKVWNANLASGIYIYRMEAVSIADANKRFVDVKKMLVLK